MTSNPTERRLQLHALGYRIIPTHGKAAKLPSWNKPSFVARELTDTARGPAAARITRWVSFWPHLQSTGVWMWGGLGAIDIDVNHPLAEAVMSAIADIVPEVFDTAPTRFGGGDYKRALFVRIEGELFRRLASRKYLRPGAGPDEKGDRVEIFGGLPTKDGNCSVHMGVYGPHSYNDDGSVAYEYRWDPAVRPLHEMPLKDIPALTAAQAAAICDAFDVLAVEAGWTPVKMTEPNPDSSVVYDITEMSRFEVEGGELLRYDELEEGMRCTSTFHGDVGHNRTKCQVQQGKIHDCLAVYDYEEATAHYPKSYAPATDDASAELMEALKRLQEHPATATGLPDEMPDPPRNLSLGEQENGTARLVNDRAAWLLQTHAFENGQIVNVYDSGRGMTERAARACFSNWKIRQVGPEGGEKPPLMAFNIWLPHEARLRTAGIKTRPDRAYPVYWDDGQLWRNRYKPPRHALSDVDEELVAEAGDLIWRLARNIAAGEGEAEYLMQHLAYKLRNPAVPGCAILFVNRVQGSGRDLFFGIASALLGEENTTRQSIHRLLGEGRFNAYLANTVLAYIPEVLDPEHKRSAYNRLKEMIDPRADKMSVNRKGIEETDEMRYATVWMATQHLDALALEEGDRRLSVLSGGPQLDDAFGAELETWRKVPAHIEALWHFMARVDLTGYVAHVPLMTDAKAQMIDLGRDKVLQALRAIAEDPDRKWKAFTIEQLERRVEARLDIYSSLTTRSDKLRNLDLRHRYARGQLVVAAMRAETKKQRRVRINGRQEYLYCFRQEQDEVKAMADDEVKDFLPEAELHSVGRA